MNKNCFICFLFALICSISLFSCKPKLQQVDFELQEPAMWIDESTRELKSSLGILFQVSVAPINFSEQDLSSLITISPSISGNWSWVNDDYLSFQPTENWKLNTKYKINFNEKLFSDNVVVNNSCSFETTNYNLSMSNAEFYIDPENTSVKRITFSLNGNVPFANEDFAKKISLTLVPNKKINLQKILSKKNTISKFHTTIIKRLPIL